MTDILVSIWMETYNHENFIAKALNSILMQKTNFNYEIIVGEDCSTDGTRAIIKEFESNYPTIIKAIYLDKNVGALRNSYEYTLPACKGKYIACLEGDDYWIDPLKLQKQIDFLEKNPQYSLCSTRYTIYNSFDNKFYYDYNYQLFIKNSNGIEIDLSVYFKYWLTKSLTVVFRRDCFDSSVVNKYKYFKDFHLFYHILKNGRGFCLNFIGGVYNIHRGGEWSSIGIMQQREQSVRAYIDLASNNLSDIVLQKNCSQTIRSYLLIVAKHNKKKLLCKWFIALLSHYRNSTNSNTALILLIYNIYREWLKPSSSINDIKIPKLVEITNLNKDCI